MSEIALRVSPAGRPPCDIVIVALDGHTIDDLLVALYERAIVDAAPWQVVLARGERVLAPDRSIAQSGLLWGDELVISTGEHAAVSPDRNLATISVVSGPDVGQVWQVGPGGYLVGRTTEADLVLRDPAVSRTPVQLHIDRDLVVSVTPPPPELPAPVHLERPDRGGGQAETGSVMTIGDSRLVVQRLDRVAANPKPTGGQLAFHRTPYQPVDLGPRATRRFGPVPVRPDRRPFQLLSVLAPLLAGLVLFATTHQPQFLILTLMSPIVMVAQSIEDRRGGRRRFGAAVAAFRTELAAFVEGVEEARERERTARLTASPNTAELVRRARLHTTELWERGRGAGDFLYLRIGLGSSSTRCAPELEPGGDDVLRAEGHAALRGLDEIDDVPIVCDLVDHAVTGVHGVGRDVDGLVRSLILQAACLHSPEDLVLVVALAPDRRFDWVKWLPHCRSASSPLPGGHLAGDTAQVDRLIGELLEVAAFRRAGDGGGGASVRAWPHLMVVIDARLVPDPADTARLLDQADTVGISVVWVADRASQVPRQATDVIEVVAGPDRVPLGRWWSTAEGVTDRHLVIEAVAHRVADRTARALAPLRDASTTSMTTSIPRTVPLLDVVGADGVGVGDVAHRWAHSDPSQLVCPIGIGPSGVVEIDLVADGPHALIGGTSGSGKSELLQSIVAGLAMNYPAAHLNFLFIDYKGGASSQVFEALPHTVGFVTNLTADRSRRALVSLKAELDYRMRLMQGRAKDLNEFRQIAPDEAPAALVLVIDEFATLVQEIPDFLAGIVDIAQRGRSLGIHLILATQRPSGSVNDNILANTNLRISLRMLERPESNAVIDSPDAADIPVPLRGRGFVRLGPSRLIAFQSAYASAPMPSDLGARSLAVAAFDNPDATAAPLSAASAKERSGTQLEMVLDLIVRADRQQASAPPRPPWCEPLAEVIGLDELAALPHRVGVVPGRHISVGVLDVPEHQRQEAAIVDLEEGGGWLIFGAGGAGKTTVLRTVAMATRDAAVEIIGFDLASRGLASLAQLPHVIDVVSGDDPEAVTRHLLVLEAELERRRALVGAAHAESLTAYNRSEPALPRVLVLIDGFGALLDTVRPAGGVLGAASERWLELLVDLVRGGRQVGIHVIITAERRAEVPSRIHASISNRLILHHVEPSGYADHGIAATIAAGLGATPGRGLWNADTLVQAACVSGDCSAQGQYAAIAQAAGPPVAPSGLVSQPLPACVQSSSLPPPSGPLRAPLGICDVTGVSVEVDCAWHGVTVVGPPRSGRSTTLAAIAVGLVANSDVVAVGSAASPLQHLDRVRCAFGGVDEVADLLGRVLDELEAGDTGAVTALVVDDLESFDDVSLTPIWERLAAHPRLRLVCSLDVRGLAGFSSHPMIAVARRARSMIVLQPDDPAELLQLTGVRTMLRPGLAMPPGRGVLFAERSPTVVQVGVPDQIADIADRQASPSCRR